MRAKDVMTTDVVTAGPETPVTEIAKTLLERRISGLPVVDEGGAVIGIVSEGDLMRREESGTERHPSWWLSLLLGPEERAAAYVKGHGRLAKDVMTRTVVTVGEDATLDEIAGLLEKHHVKRVPVVREGRLVGVVSRANLLHGLAAAKTATTPTADDETIRAAILKALRQEAGVRDEFFNVTVADGVVHLWGATDSDAERKAVRVAAENVPGVRAVDDHLGVMSTTVRGLLWAD